MLNWVACGLGLRVCDWIMLFDFFIFLLKIEYPYCCVFCFVFDLGMYLVVILTWLLNLGFVCVGFRVLILMIGCLSLVVFCAWRKKTQVVIFIVWSLNLLIIGCKEVSVRLSLDFVWMVENKISLVKALLQLYNISYPGFCW